MTDRPPQTLKPSGVLETVLYALNLEIEESFWRNVLGLEPFHTLPGRQIFYRVGDQVVLIFNPDATAMPPKPGALPVPPHGAVGDGHICFRASAAELDQWKAHLEAKRVPIEADFIWPASGGRSIYFRAPSGNCLEFAEPRIWGLT